MLTAPACLKSVWVSLDIDESYGAAMAWRLAGILIHTALGLALYGELRRDCPKPGRLLALGAGACLTGSMTCCPTMILTYPVYLLGIWALETDFLKILIPEDKKGL